MSTLRTALLWGAGAGAGAALVRKLKMDGTIDSFLERVAFQVVAPELVDIVPLLLAGVRVRWTANTQRALMLSGKEILSRGYCARC